MEDLSSCDIVIEAIVESEDVKKKLFMELDRIVKDTSVLASNTSSISITRLASATKRPTQVDFLIIDFLRPIYCCPSLNSSLMLFKFLLYKVVGMHFMNPPPVMKLVEIIRGADTSDETFIATKALAER